MSVPVRRRGPRAAVAPLPALVVAAVLVATACPSDPPPEEAPTVEEMARTLGADVVRSLARGYRAGRSGEIVVVPRPWNVVGQWTGGVRGPDDPRTTHPTPWDYHQRVPLVLYGPGHIRAGERVRRPVTVADAAPTLAELLGLDFEAPDAGPLDEALRSDDPPRAIVVLVYDGVGWNVLERWPEAWPVLRGLAEEGTVYTNAIVGSTPTVTAPIHANIGTGAFPDAHGLTENSARRPDGSIGDMFFDEADPRLLEADTVADAWDRERGNRPWVGMVGFESWHLPMMGRGAAADGVGRHAAVLWHREEERLWTNEEFYTLPEGLPGPEVLEARLDELDALDGSRDDRWAGKSLENPLVIPGTPAFVRYMGDVVEHIVREEPIGTDDLTDLLFVELKSADYAGHLWNMEDPRQAEVLLTKDEVLGDLIGLLDERVGTGEWVLALTADHGQTPLPTVSGGLRVDRYAIAADVNARFGEGVIEDPHPSELFVDAEALRRSGASLEDVCRYLGTYRYRDGIPDGAAPGNVPQDRLDEPVLAAALPGPWLEALTDEEIDALGPGLYPEGRLTGPPDVDWLLDVTG